MPGSRDEYEASVRSLSSVASRLLETGQDVELVARQIVDLRNELKKRFREGLPVAVLREMERRNLDKYGHSVGPTADWLLAKYGDWFSVVQAAARPAALRKRF